MAVHVLERVQVVPAPPAETFAFYAEARNLEKITPPWLRFQVLASSPSVMRPGTTIDYRLRLHGVPMRWRSRIEAWEPEHRFVDVQVRGPYSLWHHTHEFEPAGSGTRIRDLVRYALPLGPVGAAAHRLLVKRDLERIFDYRREAVRAALAS